MDALQKAFKGHGAKHAAAALFVLTLLSSPALAQDDTLKARAPSSQELCPSIGVRVHPMTRPVADSLGMTTPYGAIFGRPHTGSPVARAKIESGDVITAINGAPLQSWRDFGPTMSSFAPGSTVYFRTYRSRHLIERSVILGYAKCSHGQRKA